MAKTLSELVTTTENLKADEAFEIVIPSVRHVRSAFRALNSGKVTNSALVKALLKCDQHVCLICWFELLIQYHPKLFDVSDSCSCLYLIIIWEDIG